LIDRANVHEFLDKLLNGKSPEEQAATLREILIEYWVFGGIEPSDEDRLLLLDQEVADLIQRGLKIPAVKRVRELTGLALIDAKRWVEGDLSSQNKIDIISGKDASWLSLHRLTFVRSEAIICQLAKEYHVEWP